jgi:hypothetical protein
VPCPCGGFTAAPSTYVAKRTAQGKPDVNPLAGASTPQSSCIVLNWIPQGEFETAVGDSIAAAEAAYGLAHGGNPIPNTAAAGPGSALIHLTWTFAARPGAVRHAQNGVVDVENGTYCVLGAKKLAGGPPGITSTWTIVHWDGQG